MLEKIKIEIKKILRRAGVEGDIELVSPPDSKLGDLAFACFSLAKAQKKNPAEVAKELHSAIRLKTSRIIEKIEFSGPYVNFFLNTGALAALILKDIQKKDEQFGSSKLGKNKKVLIEYPSNNTHKEFHIGHFRNVCIGNTVVALYRKYGYHIIPVNYLNDFGAHVVRCLWGLKKFHAGEDPGTNPQKWLGDIYAEASRYAKEHEEVKPELEALQMELEAKAKSIWPLFMQTRQWSITGIERLFEELGVKHEQVFYEKDIKDHGQKMVDKLLKKGIAKVGEGGAIIADLSAYGLDTALLRKSSGAGLYITSDLALAQVKCKQFRGVKESIVITGSEQNFYFRQLFQLLALLGSKEKFTHIGYGLVNTTEGKMSSRLGNAILYEDLRDQVLTQMLSEVKNRHPDWNTTRIESVARTLTLAILKFTVQKHEADKNIVFDLEEAASFEGFTAPYVLYVVARITSIFKKAESAAKAIKVDYNVLVAAQEKKLLLLLADYPEIIHKALRHYNPSVVAKYCFDLAQAFNEFYHVCPVLSADTETLTSTRLSLCAGVKQVLIDALKLLTIETVEEM